MEIIATYGTWFIGLAVVFGLFMTWGIGANDAANAMGTSVGSGAITLKQAILISAIFEFSGAFLAGGEVTSTIRQGIVDAEDLAAEPELLVYGMLAALLSAGFWLLMATAKGWPVSTSHSIVGSIIGFAVVGVDSGVVHWNQVGEIVASWLISPLMGGIIAFALFMSIQRFILNTDAPFRNAQRLGPVYVFIVGFVIAGVTLFKGLTHLDMELTTVQTFLIAVAFGLFTSLLGWIFIRRVKVDEKADRTFHFASVEKVFAPMMVFTACSMAFAHGSNDVANGIGPLAAVISVVTTGGEVGQKAGLPLWVLTLGGLGIVIGVATYGYRVMRTIGTKITELTPTRGFSAELAAAFTVVLASRTGLPVSTTHIAVGAVMGVGIARGIGALDLRVIGGIVTSWLITLPISAGLSALFFFILRAIFS